MTIGRHALGWLVAGNAAGLWLSVLLLFPGLQHGEWTYGRWVPVHLDIQLFGWISLPLAGWLCQVYGVHRKWEDAIAWAWSTALAAGCLSWLEGNSSGKLFLDWKGGALAAYLAVLVFFWVLLGVSWWGGRKSWSLRKRCATLGAWLCLGAVPAALLRAESPAVYPPIDGTTGGPTGGSLLGSSLVVVGLLMIIPRAFGLPVRRESFLRMPLIFFAGSWLVFAWAESRSGTHRDPFQIFALGLLLPWVAWLVKDWSSFGWPQGTKSWRMAVFSWWALLTVSGFIEFLPGVLDRLKFTHALVAHSHLAMAGFCTSLVALLLHLQRGRFGNSLSFILWQGGAIAMVVALAVAGWAESAGPSWMVEEPKWRLAALALRSVFGAAMLVAAVHWFIGYRHAERDL